MQNIEIRDIMIILYKLKFMIVMNGWLVPELRSKNMFEWKKELELGIGSIDNQHKKWVDLANRIYSMIENDAHSDSDILKIVKELIDYTDYHFQTEETLFQKYNYPDYEVHKEAHDNFRNYLLSINFREAKEDRKKFLEQLLVKMVHWIMNHIITLDYWYKDFLIGLGANKEPVNEV